MKNPNKYISRVFDYKEKKRQNSLNIDVAIYSHPRSGTHLLASMIKEAFYPTYDLDYNNPLVKWGHWSDRQRSKSGMKNGFLFGENTHGFFQDIHFSTKKQIYIFRDPLETAYSLWRSKHFINTSYKDLTFEQFMELNLDWTGSPGRRHQGARLDIMQHWILHVSSWTLPNSSDVYLMYYKDLLENPQLVMNEIAKHFNFKTEGINESVEIKLQEKQGLSSNLNKNSSCRREINQSTLDAVMERVPDNLRNIVENESLFSL